MLIVCLALVPRVLAQDIVERSVLFSSGQDTPFEVYPWGMAMEMAEGGLSGRGQCLWFNRDWQATPWAGVRIDADDPPTFTVTEDWIENGFVRFHINVTVGRGGRLVEKIRKEREPVVGRGTPGRIQPADTQWESHWPWTCGLSPPLTPGPSHDTIG